jgi:hypothetical protein
VNFSLTDAAFHEGGPARDREASVHDTDAHRRGPRLSNGPACSSAPADHGMEQSNACTGNWAEALDAAVALRQGYPSST